MATIDAVGTKHKIEIEKVDAWERENTEQDYEPWLH